MVVQSIAGAIQGYVEHKDHILTRGGIVAKYHSTLGEKLIAAILDKLGARQTCPDDKFKVRVKALFTFSGIFSFTFIILF